MLEKNWGKNIAGKNCQKIVSKNSQNKIVREKLLEKNCRIKLSYKNSEKIKRSNYQKYLSEKIVKKKILL